MEALEQYNRLNLIGSHSFVDLYGSATTSREMKEKLEQLHIMEESLDEEIDRQMLAFIGDYLRAQKPDTKPKEVEKSSRKILKQLHTEEKAAAAAMAKKSKKEEETIDATLANKEFLSEMESQIVKAMKILEGHEEKVIIQGLRSQLEDVNQAPITEVTNENGIKEYHFQLRVHNRVLWYSCDKFSDGKDNLDNVREILSKLRIAALEENVNECFRAIEHHYLDPDNKHGEGDIEGIEAPLKTATLALRFLGEAAANAAKNGTKLTSVKWLGLGHHEQAPPTGHAHTADLAVPLTDALMALTIPLRMYQVYKGIVQCRNAAALLGAAKVDGIDEEVQKTLRNEAQKLKLKGYGNLSMGSGGFVSASAYAGSGMIEMVKGLAHHVAHPHELSTVVTCLSFIGPGLMALFHAGIVYNRQQEKEKVKHDVELSLDVYDYFKNKYPSSTFDTLPAEFLESKEGKLLSDQKELGQKIALYMYARNNPQLKAISESITINSIEMGLYSSAFVSTTLAHAGVAGAVVAGATGTMGLALIPVAVAACVLAIRKHHLEKKEEKQKEKMEKLQENYGEPDDRFASMMEGLYWAVFAESIADVGDKVNDEEFAKTSKINPGVNQVSEPMNVRMKAKKPFSDMIMPLLGITAKEFLSLVDHEVRLDCIGQRGDPKAWKNIRDGAKQRVMDELKAQSTGDKQTIEITTIATKSIPLTKGIEIYTGDPLQIIQTDTNGRPIIIQSPLRDKEGDFIIKRTKIIVDSDLYAAYAAGCANPAVIMPTTIQNAHIVEPVVKGTSFETISIYANAEKTLSDYELIRIGFDKKIEILKKTIAVALNLHTIGKHVPPMSVNDPPEKESLTSEKLRGDYRKLHQLDISIPLLKYQNAVEAELFELEKQYGSGPEQAKIQKKEREIKEKAREESKGALDEAIKEQEKSLKKISRDDGYYQQGILENVLQKTVKNRVERIEQSIIQTTAQVSPTPPNTNPPSTANNSIVDSVPSGTSSHTASPAKPGSSRSSTSATPPSSGGEKDVIPFSTHPYTNEEYTKKITQGTLNMVTAEKDSSSRHPAPYMVHDMEGRKVGGSKVAASPSAVAGSPPAGTPNSETIESSVKTTSTTGRSDDPPKVKLTNR